MIVGDTGDFDQDTMDLLEKFRWEAYGCNITVVDAFPYPTRKPR